MSTAFKQKLLVIFKAFNAVGLVILIILTFRVLGKIAQQSILNHDDSIASTTRIEQDLSCLGEFFSQKNRTSLVIVNLHDCVILDTSTGKTNVLVSSGASPSAIPPNTEKQSASTTGVNDTPSTIQSAPTAQQPVTPAPNNPPTNPVLNLLQPALAPTGNLLGIN